MQAKNALKCMVSRVVVCEVVATPERWNGALPSAAGRYFHAVSRFNASSPLTREHLWNMIGLSWRCSRSFPYVGADINQSMRRRSGV